MKPRIFVFVFCILLLIIAQPFSIVFADPVFPLPRLPFCGDQDGSESPQLQNCDRFSVNPEAQGYIVYINPNNPAQTVEIRFDFVFREAGYNNELGYFKVDDLSFAVNGLHPGDSGYLAAAYQRMKIIFPSGSDAFTPDITLSFENGDILVFFLIQDNTLAQWKENNPNNGIDKLPLAFFSIDNLNPDKYDHFVGYQNETEGLTQFGFEDLTNGGDNDYDDVVYNMNAIANPVTSAPPYTTSYYIEKRDRVGIYQLGCKQAETYRDLPGTQDGAVILDFYGPKERVLNGVKEYGLSLSNFGFVPMSEVADYAEQFAAGYYNCLGDDKDSHLRVIIGTNNSTGTYVNNASGRAFGKMINDVAAWVKNSGYSRNVDVAGGNDMEMGYNTPAATKSWVDGYSSISTRYLYNFGDAGGCYASGTTSNPGGCNNGWNQEDIWYISWKSPVAWPFPEIYATSGVNGKQWQQITLYSFYKPNDLRMIIAGSLTQYYACQQTSNKCQPPPPAPCCTDNKPDMGWSQLWTALKSDTRTTQNLRWSSDIVHWK